MLPAKSQPVCADPQPATRGDRAVARLRRVAKHATGSHVGANSGRDCRKLGRQRAIGCSSGALLCSKEEDTAVPLRTVGAADVLARAYPVPRNNPIQLLKGRSNCAVWRDEECLGGNEPAVQLCKRYASWLADIAAAALTTHEGDERVVALPSRLASFTLPLAPILCGLEPATERAIGKRVTGVAEHNYVATTRRADPLV